MKKEMTEKTLAVENTTREKMIEAIKTAKNQEEFAGEKNTNSIEVIKINKSEIIQKIES